MVAREAVADSDIFAAVETDPKARAAWLEVDTARSAARLMRDARKRLGFSQADVAKTLGVSQARISQVESGRVEDIPPLDFLARYLDACDMQLVLSTRQPAATDAVVENSALDPILFLPVDELEFSVRTTHALRNDNVVRVGDLVTRTEAELLRSPYLGHRSLNEIKEVLAQLGLELGMDVPGWPSTGEVSEAAERARLEEEWLSEEMEVEAVEAAKPEEA